MDKHFTKQGIFVSKAFTTDFRAFQQWKIACLMTVKSNFLHGALGLQKFV